MVKDWRVVGKERERGRIRDEVYIVYSKDREREIGFKIMKKN